MTLPSKLESPEKKLRHALARLSSARSNLSGSKPETQKEFDAAYAAAEEAAKKLSNSF